MFRWDTTDFPTSGPNLPEGGRASPLRAWQKRVADYHRDAKQIVVIWDNLNIHHDGAQGRWTAFNERHGGKFQFLYTPLHARRDRYCAATSAPDGDARHSAGACARRCCGSSAPRTAPPGRACSPSSRSPPDRSAAARRTRWPNTSQSCAKCTSTERRIGGDHEAPAHPARRIAPVTCAPCAGEPPEAPPPLAVAPPAPGAR